MSGFLTALPVTLALEGGYTVDQGGPTYQGVTQAAFDDYRDRHGQARRDVREIEEDERDHLYFEGYWLPAKCDKLPWPLSMVHFDHSVNSGPLRAIKTLQFSVEAKPDGIWGPKTQERIALESHDLHVLMEKMLWARLEFYYALGRLQPKLHKPSVHGWLGRMIRLRKKALELW